MKRLDARQSVFVGLGLIGLANVVALGGAWQNRFGERDSTLRLSERELTAPRAWSRRHENSGITAQLDWCSAPSLDDAWANRYFPYNDCVSPRWLDSAKLASLGFDVGVDPRNIDASRHFYRRQQPRGVFVVLELAGPAYHQALAVDSEFVRRLEARAAQPDSTSARDALKNSRGMLEDATSRKSRLYAVDAGVSYDALRSRYPDRTRYAIVRATVQPRLTFGDPPVVRGYIGNLTAATIHVPRRLAGAFDSLPPSYTGTRAPTSKIRLDAELAIGSRLEPWLTEAKTIPR